MAKKEKNIKEQEQQPAPLLPAKIFEGSVLTLVPENEFDMQGTSEATRYCPGRVKIMTGGIEMFQFPNDKTVKFFQAFLLHKSRTRGYYRDDVVQPGRMPDCWSADAAFPNSDVSWCPLTEGPLKGMKVSCASCPMSVFKSDPKGKRGQACKERLNTHFFYAGPDPDLESGIPYQISLPPTSLRAMDEYCTGLIGAGIPMQTVVTNVSLVHAQNQAGQGYSKLTLARGGRISKPEEHRLKAYFLQLVPLFKSQPMTSEDFEEAPVHDPEGAGTDFDFQKGA